MNPVQDLAAKHSYLDTIIQNSWDGILVVDAEGRFEFGNPAFFRIFGWRSAELIGESFFKVIPDDLQDFMGERWQEVQDGRGRPYETEILRPDGTRCPITVTHRHMDIDGMRKYCVIVHDNSEQMKRVAELDAYRTRLEEMVAARTRELTQANVLLQETVEERKQIQASLEESERNFRAIAENAGEIILIERADNRVLYANTFTVNLLEYTCAELIGMNALDLVIPAERETMQAYTRRRMSNQPVPGPYETTLLAKSGKRIDVEVTGTRTQWRGETAVLAFMRDVSKRREMAKDIINIGHMERERIGRDFHDSLGQNLTGLAFFCKALQLSLAKEGSPHHNEAEKITKMVKDIIAIARRIARGLAPVDIPEEGLGHALRQLARDTREACDVSCLFREVGLANIRDHAVAAHLFRIAQEAVNNALKHADPKQITMTLQANDTTGILTVTNDGTPYTGRHNAGDGIGLRIMRHRASVMNGRLTLTGGNPTGAVLSCTFANRVPAETASSGAAQARKS